MHLFSVFSLRNRALIALITVVVAIFGGISITSLKQELIPAISLPSVYIVSTYAGASPDVVNTDVSAPIESAIQGIENLDSSTATSNTNSSTVTASFSYGTNISTAEQKVQLAIDRISTTLPKGVTPQVITFNFSDLPVIQLAVTSKMDKHTLASRLAAITVSNLKQLAGVSDASLLGAATQRVTITPDAAKLTADGLRTQAISQALAANGTLLASGSITEKDTTLTVQSGSRLASTDAIGALPLLGTRLDPAPLIRDVATVALVDDPQTGISRVNGKPSVTISVSKAASGNTVAVSKEVQEAIPALEKQLGGDTKFTVVYDQAPSITQSINSLAEEGLLGLVFAVIIILIFLLSIRSTLVTAISIPVSVLITFIGMLASGYTLNVITLAALTIAIGRVVDDSIVVIENIKRHIELGEEKLQAIQVAVKEVAGAVTASTITTVAVFLPIALVNGITGELFRPFALTVTIALAASLFVALTIVPVLAYWFLGAKVKNKHSGTVPGSATASSAVGAGAAVATAAAAGAAAAAATAATAATAGGAPAATVSGASRSADAALSNDELDRPTRLQKVYLPVIRWSTTGLLRPFAVVMIAILVLGGTVAIALSGALKTNFIGNSGQNTLTINQTLALGSSLAADGSAARKVEDALLATTGVKTVQLSVGSGGSSLAAAFSGNSGNSFAVTTDPNADQAKLQATVTSRLKQLTGVGVVTVSAAASSFTSSNIEIDVTAGSNADLRVASDAIIARVTGLHEVAAVSSNLSAALPYIAVTIDRAKAAADGLSEVQVGSIVAQAMNPSASGSVVIDEKTLSIYLADSSAPTTEATLANFSIPTLRGTVPLSDLATVATVNGPSSITTVKGLRSATIKVTPGSDNVGNASNVVAAAVAKAHLPASATATLGGVTSQQGDAFSQLGLALLAAILIVYVVMVAAFKSLRQPLLLLISVPFAATGAIVLQVISGIPLGVASLIGVLMLIGIVVTNAIVLVDLINQYRVRGMTVGEAIIHGASRRLRPILMTALATIFALLPLGIGVTGHGGFISQPLAIVVIGGLVSSTVLTLIVLPTLYYLVEGAKERREERSRASSVAAPVTATAG